MMREIKKKLIILGNRAPFPAHVRDFLRETEELDWICMNLQLDGSPLNRDQIKGILDGQPVLTGRIADHVLLERLISLLNRLYDLAARKADIDADLLEQLRGILEDGGQEPGYRRTGQILTEYQYTPPLAAELPALMHAFYRWANYVDPDPLERPDPFMRAAEIHNEFLRIWPYRQGNGFLARALMEYHLLREGYPGVSLTWSEPKYNGQVADFLRSGDSRELGETLRTEVFRRLELMMQLTGHEN